MPILDHACVAHSPWPFVKSIQSERILEEAFECTLVMIKSHLFIQPSALLLVVLSRLITECLNWTLHVFFYDGSMQSFCRIPCVQTRLSIRSQMFIRPRVVVTSDPPRISPDVGTQKSKNPKIRNPKIHK